MALMFAAMGCGGDDEPPPHAQALRERPHPCGAACEGEIVKISTGMVQTCVLYEAGGLVCWGVVRGVAEDVPQNPDWVTYSRWFPPAVMAEGMSDVVDMAAGTYHTCAVRRDGSLWCWGGNDIGQLGHGGPWGRHQGQSLVPRPVVRLEGTPVADVVRVCSGPRSYGVTRSGQMFSTAGWSIAEERISAATELWGSDNADCGGGQATHLCNLKRDGRVECAGSTNNEQGELGFEGKGKGVGFVEGLDDAVEVAVGMYFSCAVRASGKVACWGTNGFGELGRGVRTDANHWKAEEVVGIDDAVHIGAGGGTACAIRRGGQLSCWGMDTLGLMKARERFLAVRYSAVPVDIESVPDAVDVDMSANHLCVARRGGVVACTGDNSAGQTNPNPEPVPYGELQLLRNLPP